MVLSETSGSASHSTNSLRSNKLRTVDARPSVSSAGLVNSPSENQFVPDPNPSAFGDFGVDAHQIVAEAALQFADDVEVAFGGGRVDLRRGAAGDRGDHPEARAAERDLGADPIEFAPRRRPLEIDIGAKAQRIDRRSDTLL